MTAMKQTHLLLLVAALALAGCRSQLPYAYVGDAPRNIETDIETTFSSTIHPGDQLYIYVASQTPESVIPFNQETNMIARNRHAMHTPSGYLVAEDGYIMFPTLGRITAAGLSREELAHRIEGLLIAGEYVSDPVVSIRLMNFHVTVIGEVKTPRQLTATGDRLTILEAIAQCGDVTMSGIRSCVTVLREDDGTITVDTVDLTSATLFDSPFYYLQQNDIVYVEPTPKRKREAYRDEDWPKYLTTGIAALRIAWNVYYRYVRLERRLNR